MKKLIVSSFLIDNQRQMVTVSKFKNSEEAMDYYNILIKDETFKQDIDNKIIEVYVMSATNYTTFYNKRDERDKYPAFFNSKYINNK